MVNKKGFNPAKDGAIYAIGAQFPQQASVWYSIEGLGKIQNGHINRYMLVTFKQEILDCNKQLRFT